MNIDRDRLVNAMHGLADTSAAAILPYFRTPLRVSNKAGLTGFDPVTCADQAAERSIRNRIKQTFPSHEILGEEYGEEPATGTHASRYRWIIDPIDGTRAFILGFPTWGTLIGLAVDGHPILGMMNQPFTGERFWSDGDDSYFRRHGEQPCKIRTRASSLEDAQLATTAPELFADGDETAAFRAIDGKVRSRRYGGDCYAYCMLAAGHIDIVMEAGLNPYDIAALIPIIENAGGTITTWAGEPAHNGGRILACGSAALHAAVIDCIADTIPARGG